MFSIHARDSFLHRLAFCVRILCFFCYYFKTDGNGRFSRVSGYLFERNGVSGVVDRRPVYGQGFWGLVHKGGYLVFSGHASCSSVLSHEFVLMLLSRSFSMHFPDDIRYVQFVFLILSFKRKVSFHLQNCDP